MSNTLLKVDNLHVYYGSIHAIKGISFEVNEGEIVTLIGANGAGKSTTLNTVAGLLKPRSGSILLHDQNIVGVPADKIVSKGMAFCPEGRRIFLQMTVLENLEMGGYTRPNSELEESIENVYDHFPRLKERYKQLAGTLSGGEQQMLAIGRALMGNPKVLLLDEPSLGLAPILVRSIFSSIEEINSTGVTIILVEQNARAALKIAARGYVMEVGKVVMEDDAKALLANPEVQAAYLGGA